MNDIFEVGDLVKVKDGIGSLYSRWALYTDPKTVTMIDINLFKNEIGEVFSPNSPHTELAIWWPRLNGYNFPSKQVLTIVHKRNKS
jgi:hypothetical protein